MSDTVTLRIPQSPQYYSVARLVVGGLAAGLSLSYDALDDLQLAIGSLLDNESLLSAHDGPVTIRLAVDEDRLQASLGEFSREALQTAFANGGGSEEKLDLRRLLDTIVDDVEISTSEAGGWVTLTKRVKAVA